MLAPIVLAAAVQSAQPDEEKAGAVPPSSAASTSKPDADEKDTQAAAGEPGGGRSPDEDQDEDQKAVPATHIVVTARRLDIARTSIEKSLGATVYELHNETIENRPGGETGSISSILTQLPAVTLSSSGINIRGSRAIQVRINGTILPEAISDPEDRLSSRLAESTSLIMGTLPAQFGFAPGGVISVTTKNGLYQHGGQLELFAGSNGAFEPAFEWGSSAGSSSLFATGSMEEGRTKVADVSGPSADNLRREIGGLAFADHVIDEENRISLVLGGSREWRRIGATDLPSGEEQTGDAFAVATVQHSTSGVTVQASLFGGSSRNSADFVRRQAETGSSAGTQIDTSFQLGKRDSLRSGLLFTRLTSHDSHSPLPTSIAQRTSLGIYVQDEWSPDSNLTFNGGVRADWLRSLGASPVLEPRASVVWALPSGFTAHAGYARYASAPPIGEERSGARLPDEHDDYLDAGVQQKLGPLTLGLDGYYRSAQDLIAEHLTPGNAVPAAFAFSRGRFGGVELSATYARGPISAWGNLTLSKSQGRTIIDSESLFPAEIVRATEGRWVNLASDRPVTASGGVTWRIGKLDFSGDVIAGSGAVRTFEGSNPNGGRAAAFASLGIAAVYHARMFDQPLDLRADLTNLTNVHYLTNDAANLEGDWTQFAVGRAILVGFEQGF